MILSEKNYVNYLDAQSYIVEEYQSKQNVYRGDTFLYEYDELQRLKEQTVGLFEMSYSYDLVGSNTFSGMRIIGTSDYLNSTSAQFSDVNLPVSITNTAGGNTDVMTYEYDALGRQTQKDGVW